MSAPADPPRRGTSPPGALTEADIRLTPPEKRSFFSHLTGLRNFGIR
jgi:hypothetical protein